MVIKASALGSEWMIEIGFSKCMCQVWLNFQVLLSSEGQNMCGFLTMQLRNE